MTSNLSRLPGIAVLAAVLATAMPVFGASEKPDGETPATLGIPSPEFPVTIQKVWYRTDKNTGFGKSYKMGDLVVSTDSLEFVHRKRGWKVPLHDIHMMSMGKMKGDVDTEWVVLSLRSEKRGSLRGLRDGRKMGFGGRTGEIFEILKRAVEQASAAQYDVPEGFRAHTDLEHLFTVGIPEDWSAYNRSRVIQEGKVREGTVVFFEGRLPEGVTTVEDGEASPEVRDLLDGIATGEKRSFLVERRTAGKGMRCSGLDPEVVSVLSGELAAVWNSPTTGEIDDVEVDGCRGARFRIRGPGRDGNTRIADVTVVSHGRMLYLFRIEVLEEYYEAARETLEASMDTVRFSLAR
jgi:hypothetical protein